MCIYVLSGKIVYIFLWEDIKMYAPGTIANSEMTTTKINKNGAIAKVKILVEQKILWGI